MRIKKQTPRTLTAIFLILLLTSCAQTVPKTGNTPDDTAVPPEQSPILPPEESPSEEPSIEPSNPATLYQNILLGTGTFFSTDAGKDLTISRDELYQIISEDLVPTEAEKFSLIDLDNDGADELILQLNVNRAPESAYEILRYQDGRVYGYTKWPREITDLKSDGTFFFSGGAANTGIGSLRFDADGCTTDTLTYTEMSFDSDNNQIFSYTVNGQNSNADAFQAALDAQEQKTGAVWHALTESNIALAFQ